MTWLFSMDRPSDPCKAKVNRAWPRSLKLNLYCESGTAQPCWLEDFGNGTVSSLAPPCPHSTQESHTASSGDQAIRGHEMGHSIEMLAHRPSALSFLLSASQGHSHLEYKSLPRGHPPTAELVRWEINRSYTTENSRSVLTAPSNPAFSSAETGSQRGSDA